MRSRGYDCAAGESGKDGNIVKNDAHDELYRDVLCFIGRFSTFPSGQCLNNAIVELFTCGCCWWFAYILSVRFADYQPEIMVDLVANHFGCRIDGRVYDICGDATDAFEWQSWDEYDDEAHKKRISEQCIMF